MRQEDLRSIVTRSFQLIHHHLQIHNIKPVVELGKEAVSVNCDPQQIEQALLALEINAVEAMPEGGTLTLRLERGPDGEHVRVVVSDTGCGIRQEDLPHIFEPFFTTKEGGKGTGLGLAVTYGIVQRHSGTIDVESALQSGTTFVITLPIGVLAGDNSSDSIHHVYG
jgi:two-component system NtrC family sensor kinase